MAEKWQEEQAGEFTLTTPVSAEPPAAAAYTAPEPDEKWEELPNGFAHVFYGEGNKELTRPVIMADGFSLGKSDLKWLYSGLDRDFPLLTELRRQGRDVILVGYEERSASILDNAQAVIAAITLAGSRELGNTLLTVGGFSMGGLVARYALARLEQLGHDHRTGLYFSYDTPHRGAVVPIALQAFAHFIPWPNNPFARQMNSPAARQMLWRHYDPKTRKPVIAPERTQFLKDLAEAGGWPSRPRKLALANGRGDGVGLQIPPGERALKLGRVYPDTAFYTQAQGKDVTVAELKRWFPPLQFTVSTSDLPELDGAPGGTLHSYRIVADALKKVGATADLRHENVCFVPTVSAVAIRDIDQHKDLYTNIDDLDPEESEVDEFICSPDTTAHTAVTDELGQWLLRQLLY
ncbi:esterase/lipase family protein [Streptomyces sp. enrichment culture]|uniref:esterase/lipase family protein n=1 Tax=Streptomyces sp. enrichment culture TaxID=1795815 RepID=UPI003F5577E3